MESRIVDNFTNFDYGFFAVDRGTWFHANHSEPGMEVYESTLNHYSRPLLDFNRQIFVPAVSTVPKPTQTNNNSATNGSNKTNP